MKLIPSQEAALKDKPIYEALTHELQAIWKALYTAYPEGQAGSSRSSIDKQRIQK